MGLCALHINLSFNQQSYICLYFIRHVPAHADSNNNNRPVTTATEREGETEKERERDNGTGDWSKLMVDVLQNPCH